ncbi:MAG: dihydrodipicolinate synthase family protein [Rickettsiales bacterium]|jgi:4-hydroxy-tetrahydrodipicolinate synthase|nr:dihydrodipicolinate synthase family protein [Rickettsiales bacterium]
MSDLKLRGVITAMVTPFLKTGEFNKRGIPIYPIDEHGYEQLLDFQFHAGINGLVIAGTTGEAPQLTHDEKGSLTKTAVAKRHDALLDGTLRKWIPIIVGTGSSDYVQSIEDTYMAADKGPHGWGANGVLVANPPYIKWNKRNVIGYFNEHNKAGIPIVIYNVPSRTAQDMPVEWLGEIAEMENVVGIKEASPDINKSARIINEIKYPLAAQGKEFSVLSGNDDMTRQVIAEGGDGIVSVASNIIPDKMVADTWAAFNGKWHTSAPKIKMQKIYNMTTKAGNPDSIKAMMRTFGLPAGPTRTPVEFDPAVAREIWLMMQHKGAHYGLGKMILETKARYYGAQ